MKRLIPLAALLLAASPLMAANHYVRAGATGNGTDWANACGGFSGACSAASLVRGDTYYVASGSYGSINFSTPASGTAVITIQGATVADHGTNTGWVNSMSVDKNDGGSQATFGTSLSASTPYWVITGVAGDLVPDPTAYGFGLLTGNCPSGPSVSVGGCSNNHDVTLSHISVNSCGSTSTSVNQHAFQMGGSICNLSAITISHNYMANANESIDIGNMHDSTMEYNYMEKGWSTSANHGDTVGVNAPSVGNSNDVFRYNIVKDCTGTGGIIALGVGNAIAINNWDIYGNVFHNCGGGNGVIASGGDNYTIANTRIYNNTFSNSARIFHQCNVGSSGCSSSSGNVIKNNVIWNGDPTIDVNGGGAIIHDYNTCISVNAPCPSEAHGQTFSDAAGTNTFMAPGALNFQLTSDTAVASGDSSIGAPYNFDMDGNQRGADGTWERGAFEYASTSSPKPPTAPTGLAALVQ